LKAGGGFLSEAIFALAFASLRTLASLRETSGGIARHSEAVFRAKTQSPAKKF